jgi:IS30 family transposase
MDKRLAIQHLHQASFTKRQIVDQLQLSRNAVRRYLGRSVSKGTKAPPGSAPTGSEGPKGTKAPTGSSSESSQSNRPKSASKCAAYHEVILAKLEQGLTGESIHQYLVKEHQFAYEYHSVRRDSNDSSAAASHCLCNLKTGGEYFSLRTSPLPSPQ